MTAFDGSGSSLAATTTTSEQHPPPPLTQLIVARKELSLLAVCQYRRHSRLRVAQTLFEFGLEM
jgi:hypothetical protein